uniref:Uncharacterized protein n=1 Tax=Lactuca sativa TaxID=4236 RepID=A0A9R1WBW6_LACSA|nr:hypothetical protein LSAT_V11C200095230 [Lactuca sativa]
MLLYFRITRAAASWRVEIGGLPGLEALQVPGTKDGHTIVVRKDDNGVAYAWNRQNQTWDKNFLFPISDREVIDGPDDGNGMKRPVLDGVQYDYGQPFDF